MPRPRLIFAISLAIVAAVLALALWWWLAPSQRELSRPWEAVVTTFAGGHGVGIRDGASYGARFSEPFGIAATERGEIYVADGGDAQRIRHVGADGHVTTLAGGDRGFADGPGASARFDTPSGLAIGPDGAIYVADTANNAVRRVTIDGVVSTVAGDGSAGYVDALGSAARFNGPIGVAVDATGRVVVADTYNDRIRAVENDGTVVTLAGDGRPGYLDGAAAAAQFNTPCGVAIDAEGTIYVADTGNSAIRVISPSGLVSTLASPPGLLHRPIGVAVGSDEFVYVTDERGAVVEIAPDRAARTLAGSGPGFDDGAGAAARFRAPAGLAVLGPARLVVADRRNAALRLVAARVQLEFRTPGPPRESRPTAAAFPRGPLLWPLAPFDGPFEITGTFGEARGTYSERFHSGVDIHGRDGSTVHAVQAGVVSDPIAAAGFGTLNESVRIGSLVYVHLRVGRERRNGGFEDSRFVHSYDQEGRLVQVRVKRGARFTTGEPVGTVNAFSHVHLNVGWPGEEVNPLERGLVQFEDTIAPVIARGGIRLFAEDGQPLTERRHRRLVVSGRVRIVVDAWDQVNGNARRRRLGLYRLGYQILHRDGIPAEGFETPRETIRFDRLTSDAYASRMVYAAGTGIPEYGRRSTRFFYIVTTTLRGGAASAGAWDAAGLPPGDYILRILAADINGNEATANRDLPITIVAPGVLH